MLDRYALNLIRPGLEKGAILLQRRGVHPDAVTIAGFVVGLMAAAMIAGEQFRLGLVLLLLNRLCDGLDGALARQTKPTGAGAYLDICLDFFFYGTVVFAFALADPAKNGLAGGFLLLTFIGTGSSFLAFAIIAAQKQLASTVYPRKGFYYLGGLTEGTETIICFVFMCLFPHWFPVFALVFGAMCLVTTAVRVVSGYFQLRER